MPLKMLYFEKYCPLNNKEIKSVRRAWTFLKSSYTRYLLIWELLLHINFRELQKIKFSRTFIIGNQKKYLFRFYWVSPYKHKHSSDDSYNFVKMAQIHETCDAFCNVERWPTVTWTCQHSASAIKKHLKF